ADTGRDPSIVMVVLDEWSADHSTLPGLPYHRETTPRLGMLAREGRVYTRVYSSSLSSPPSLGAVFTGVPAIRLYGSYPRPVLRPMQHRSFLTQAARHGYRVAYVYSADNVSPAGIGLAHNLWAVHSPVGCTWSNRYVELGWVCSGLQYVIRYVRPHEHPHPRATLALAEKLVRELVAQERPYILFVHVLAPHEPFRPDSADRALLGASGHFDDLYEAYLRTTDRLAAAFVDRVRARAPRALVMILADHGLRHGVADVNRQTFHVPLVLLGDTVSPGVDTTLLSLSEIWPRVLSPRVPALAAAPAPLRIGGAIIVQHWDRHSLGAVAGDTFCWLAAGAPRALCQDPGELSWVKSGRWRPATPREDSILRDAVAMESRSRRAAAPSNR
ncbi:MAG: sulfatase-like hydrolase/transferase, partial [Gemmatimonadetes bacterium]|nr:sulfatase-like hydrolase/transferase [Gemmatimonadota bacterium]